MSAKRIRYLVDRVWDGRYVRAWKDGRLEIVVQVWDGTEPTGEPAGDWAMPSALGPTLAITQAMAQTPATPAEKPVGESNERSD